MNASLTWMQRGKCWSLTRKAELYQWRGVAILARAQVQHDGACVDALLPVDFPPGSRAVAAPVPAAGSFRSPRSAAGGVAPGQFHSPMPLHGRHAAQPREQSPPSRLIH